MLYHFLPNARTHAHRHIYIYIYIYIYIFNCLCGSVAKASETQAVGHEFEPRPDH